MKHLAKRVKNYLAVFAAVVIVNYFLKKKNRASTKAKVQYSEVPLAHSTGNKLMYWLIGHVADFHPWKCKEIGLISMRMLQNRFKWYKSVGTNAHSVRTNIVNDSFLFTKDISVLRTISGKEDCLFRNSDTIRKSFGKLFPESIAMLTGNKWKRVRRAFVSAMHKLDLESLPQITHESLKNGFQYLVTDDYQEINLWDTFSSTTFDTFMKFSYGIEFGTMKNGAKGTMLEVLREITKKSSDRLFVNFPLLWQLPFGDTPRLYQLRDVLNNFISAHIDTEEERYDQDPVNFKSKTSKNLVEALVVTTRECTQEKKKVNKSEVISMLVAAMFGGFDTTTSSMSFLCLALCKHPEYQEKLYNELKDIDLTTAKKSDLDNLPYLNGFIKETQRLYSVAPVLIRVPNEDIVINDTLIKKDTNIMLDTEAIGKDPKNWNGMNDLEVFRPERFFDFTPSADSFTPFGFGARKCPGYRVAHVQLQTILSYLIQNYVVDDGSKPIEVRCSLGVTVSSKSTVTLIKRNHV